ncbi:MAG: hypothetical protein ACE5FB_04515 [Candidatus Binatia bacterium]
MQDVVIHTNERVHAAEALFRVERLPRERFQLADDLWVGRLDDEVAQRVFDSCTPPGSWVNPPVRPFGQLYAFVREPAPPDPIYTWDSDKRLLTCVALSRLVHPTSLSFCYAARLIYGSDRVLREVVPGPVKGHGADVFLTDEDGRDWLTTDELEILRDLIRLLTPADLPPRIWRAFWYHEYAVRTFYADVRCTLICTALEALVHTDRSHSTQQFATRVPRLAAELEIEFNEDNAEIAYDLRSQLSHGQGVQNLTEDDRRIYTSMETILQQGLVRAIRDTNFAQTFSTPERIRDRWPLPR